MNGSQETSVIALSPVENCLISEISATAINTNNSFVEKVLPEDTLAVIEISDDGTWETKPVSSEDLNNIEVEKDGKSKEENDSKGGFLTPGDDFIVESVKIKHVSLAHSSQYYVNCPVASVKPMVHDTIPNGKVAEEILEGKAVRVNDVISDENGTAELECQSSLHVAMTNGASVTMEEIEGLEVVEEEEYHSCQCVVPKDPADDNMASEEVHAKSVSKPVTVPEEEFAVNPSGDLSGGDVVTDSILQNKEKTKTYWEEMMLAAASGKDSLNKSRQSEGKSPEDEDSHATFYDSNGEGSVWATCPKIVETVAKRTEDGAETPARESVIEKEIRMQREREEAVQRERQEAQRMMSPEPEKSFPEDRRASSPAMQRLETTAEVRIAQELREMKEREEELRKLRQQLGLTKEPVNEALEAFHSIPTTDEGNFSECGGEEKDLGMEVIGSQILSTDMPSLDMTLEHNSFMHRRTQSTDSTSSGHSSGSGGPRLGVDYPRRRVMVKPLTDSDEEGSQSQLLRRSLLKEDDDMNSLSSQPSNLTRNMKETPIEREIRIAREREEELRREKGLIQQPNQTTVTKPQVPPRNVSSTITPPPKSQQNVQLRIATNRIQREIQETTEREKELRDAGKIQTISMDTVDSMVTRIGEISESDGVVQEHNMRMQKSMSASHISIPESSPSEPEGDIIVHSPAVKSSFTLGRSMSTNTGLSVVGSTNSVSTPSPRRFTPMSGQKGIMERFIASRGKLNCISTFSPPSSLPSANGPTSTMHNNFPVKNASPAAKFNSPIPAKVVSPAPTLIHRPIAVVENNQVANDIEQTENTSILHRRGWMSAEEKIQEELKQMKLREDELRLQRAHIMAQSQPNLLSIMDESEERSLQNDDDNEKMPSLYGTLSNPNLLDLDVDLPVKENDFSQDQVAQKNARRKSALIAHWESRIQQNTDQ